MWSQRVRRCTRSTRLYITSSAAGYAASSLQAVKMRELNCTSESQLCSSNHVPSSPKASFLRCEQVCQAGALRVHTCVLFLSS